MFIKDDDLVLEQLGATKKCIGRNVLALVSGKNSSREFLGVAFFS